jgi:hypothetical protein
VALGLGSNFMPTERLATAPALTELGLPFEGPGAYKSEIFLNFKASGPLGRPEGRALPRQPTVHSPNRGRSGEELVHSPK